jgi:PIF1-like helicase
LLVIDKYSFLSAATIDALDHQLHKIFPQATYPFGSLNIVLCGDPAQLPPVLAQPVYAHQGSTRHLAAHFHLFNKVVKLDEPFCQAENDETQKRFRLLLHRVANCEGTDEDWAWLQTWQASRLSPRENAAFDKNKYIVLTNDMRSHINCEKLSMLSPIMQITQTKDGMCVLDEDEVDRE